MLITEVTIKKRASYEELPGQLVGSVTLIGTMGKQEIILSSVAISRMFKVISEEVCATAKSNAEQVRGGMKEAIHAPLLAAAASIGIGEDL